MSQLAVLFLALFGLLIAAMLVLFWPIRRSQSQTGGQITHSVGPIDRQDERYWRGGMIYYNPDDPDPFVPKRFGIGWTVNFAHPGGKVILAVMVAMVLLPIALAIFDPALSNNAVGCHPGNCHLTP